MSTPDPLKACEPHSILRMYCPVCAPEDRKAARSENAGARATAAERQSAERQSAELSDLVARLEDEKARLKEELREAARLLEAKASRASFMDRMFNRSRGDWGNS